ncbi:Gremlin-2, partial [Stegodyphus mimosarum]
MWFLGLGFCMPPNPDGEKNFQNSVENSSTLEMYSMPSQGKTYVRNLEMDNVKFDEQPSHLNQDINQKIISFHSVNRNANSSTGWILPDGFKEDFDGDVSEILLQNNDIDDAGVPNSFFVGDLLIVKGKEVLLKDDDSTPEESVVHVRHRTSSSMNRAEVVPFIDEDSRKLGNRNLSRKRRQRPDTRLGHRRHRKRKRRHRLVLKPRENNRNYLTDSKEDTREQHRLLLNSDSPGYVISSASEVKKDWCRTIPLRQKVSETHCRSKNIMNNFCYGQCNSFFIPQAGRTGNNKVAFQSSAFCKPHRRKWANITLSCPGRDPPKVYKTVLIVESCRCSEEKL